MPLGEPRHLDQTLLLSSSSGRKPPVPPRAAVKQEAQAKPILVHTGNVSLALVSKVISGEREGKMIKESKKKINRLDQWALGLWISFFPLYLSIFFQIFTMIRYYYYKWKKMNAAENLLHAKLRCKLLFIGMFSNLVRSYCSI